MSRGPAFLEALCQIPGNDTQGYNPVVTDPRQTCEGYGAMDGSRHILVVDDDKELRGLLSRFLTGNGFRVSVAQDATAMTQTMSAARIDLIILDIMMPGEDGLSVCRRLRANGTIPIIMLTAKGSELERVVGLEMGADDYLAKPFGIHELLARVRAVLRRAAMPVPGSPAGARRVFEFAGWRLDVSRRELRSPANALVGLRAAKFDVLLALVEHPQRVLSRDQLLDSARGRAGDAFDRTIDLYISRLRRRLEDDPKEPALIKTMRSEGYIFTADVTVNGAPW
jgi:two-component system, OmpR family, response regulator